MKSLILRLQRRLEIVTMNKQPSLENPEKDTHILPSDECIVKRMLPVAECLTFIRCCRLYIS